METLLENKIKIRNVRNVIILVLFPVFPMTSVPKSLDRPLTGLA